MGRSGDTGGVRRLRLPLHGESSRSREGLRRRLGDRLRFVFRVFPLTRIHAHAQAAAEAAEAAAAQGQFWEMHDRLFEAHRKLEDADLRRYAEEVGLDIERFEKEMEDHTHAARVREDLKSGLSSGVPGTPTFFINGVRHDGPNDFETLLAALEATPGRQPVIRAPDTAVLA